ncbi:MAG TPA: FAD-dependent oxidoreductase [Kofleriaceae bacterium]|nr:FAD-dependent oxidoreductase [Kofleriaceae bacterium]
MERNADVVVIGGGLGGLASAVLLARSGRSVVLLEKSPALGGRAATHEERGARLNLGPHALYCGGAGRALLRELGVDPSGGRPAASGMLALDRGRLHALPVGFASLLSTGLLRLGEKLEAARVLQSLQQGPDAGPGESVADWIDRIARRAVTRRLLHALVRVTTYASAPDLVAAREAAAQMQLALTSGVMYVDGGWQTIVDQLRARAVESGVAIHTGSRVEAVAGGRVRIGGASIEAGAVVIATSPAAARALVPSSAALAEAERAAVPVRAACLDLALSSLPRPRALFCLGIDEPLYYSVHSGSAALAPEGVHVVHVARYLAPGEKADDSSLEALLDRVQPGWRERVVARRFLPQLVVANDILPVGRRRPGPELAGAGVYLVGDWVGEGAMLADATLASARAAAGSIATARPRPAPAPRADASSWSGG